MWVCVCIRFLTSQAGPTKHSLHSFLVAELTTAGVQLSLWKVQRDSASTCETVS